MDLLITFGSMNIYNIDNRRLISKNILYNNTIIQ